MPQTSSLYQQAADIGYTVLQNCVNGQTNAQNQKIYIEGLAAAVIQLAQCINNIANSTTAVGGTIAASLAANCLTPGNQNAASNNLIQSAGVSANAGTFIPPNFVGPIGGSDPVAFNGAGGLNAGIQNTSTGAAGTGTIIATQQP
jgi:hypothetical protein